MFLNKESGQSIFEAVIAMAVFTLMALSVGALVIGSLNALYQGGEQTEAAALAQEGIEAVRAIRDGAWNKMRYGQSAVGIIGNVWDFLGEGTTERVGQYTRTINFGDVCRDDEGNIVGCPGSYNDAHSKMVTATVNWEGRPGTVNSVRQVLFLTNWESSDWVEDSLSDFNDGSFNDTVTSTTAGDGDAVVLKNY